MLEELARAQRIGPRDVTYAMEGYADNLLGDLVYNVERAIEHEIEAETQPDETQRHYGRRVCR